MNNSPSLLALSCTSHNLSVELSGAASASFNFSAKACPKKTNLEVFWNVYALTWFIKYWNCFIRQCFVPGHLQLLTQGQKSRLQPSSLSQTSQSSVATAGGSAQPECTFTLEGLCKHAQMWILIQFIRMGRWNKWSVLCLHALVSCFLLCMCVCIVHLVGGQWHMRQESVQQCSAFGLRWLQHCLMLLWKNRSNTQSNCLKCAPITFHSSVENHSITHTTKTMPRFVSSHRKTTKKI